MHRRDSCEARVESVVEVAGLVDHSCRIRRARLVGCDVRIREGRRGRRGGDGHGHIVGGREPGHGDALTDLQAVGCGGRDGGNVRAARPEGRRGRREGHHAVWLRAAGLHAVDALAREVTRVGEPGYGRTGVGSSICGRRRIRWRLLAGRRLQVGHVILERGVRSVPYGRSRPRSECHRTLWAALL